MEPNEQPAAPETDGTADKAQTGDAAAPQAGAGTVPQTEAAAVPQAEAGASPQPESGESRKAAPSPGLSPRDFAALAGEYPAFAAAGEAGLPADVRKEVQAGRTLLDACRLHELREAKAAVEALTAQLAAERANKAGAAASTGSLAGGAGGEKSEYTPGEWDKLPASLRQKFIRSGRIFDFMKKWGK